MRLEEALMLLASHVGKILALFQRFSQDHPVALGRGDRAAPPLQGLRAIPLTHPFTVVWKSVKRLRN